MNSWGFYPPGERTSPFLIKTTLVEGEQNPSLTKGGRGICYMEIPQQSCGAPNWIIESTGLELMILIERNHELGKLYRSP